MNICKIFMKVGEKFIRKLKGTEKIGRNLAQLLKFENFTFNLENSKPIIEEGQQNTRK